MVGHTHGFDPAVSALARIIEERQYGRLSTIAMWNYTDFLYRPRRPEELDVERGGGILFNQLPHQVDVARTLARSSVIRVEAYATALDPTRPVEGSCAALIGFESGACASLVYSGYDRFDTDEFCDWVGENGQPKAPSHGATRKRLMELGGSHSEQQARIEGYGYGGDRHRARQAIARWSQPHFGVLVVSCEHAEFRPIGDRLLVYGRDGLSELSLPAPDGTSGRKAVLDELWSAVRLGTPPVHDGSFGRETLATCLAIRNSARANGVFPSNSMKLACEK